jgi:hypothetical protein
VEREKQYDVKSWIILQSNGDKKREEGKLHRAVAPLMMMMTSVLQLGDHELASGD